MKKEETVIEHNFDDCEHLVTTYYEYDTGYAEYGCAFLRDKDDTEFPECLGEYCPFSIKYRVE